MRTNMKIFGIAAILTSVSGAALAQEAVETQVPKSLEDSRLVEQGDVCPRVVQHVEHADRFGELEEAYGEAGFEALAPRLVPEKGGHPG